MDMIVVPFHDYKKWINEGFRTRDAHILQHAMNDSRVDKILVINRPVSMAEMLLKRKSWKTSSENVVYKEKRFQVTQMEKNVWCVDIFLPDIFSVIRERKRWWFSSFCNQYVLEKVQSAIDYLNMKDTVLLLQNPMAVGLVKSVSYKLLAFDAIDNWLHHPQMNDSYDLIESNYKLMDEKADVILTVSEALKEIFPTNPNVNWVPNGVDISFFSNGFGDTTQLKKKIVIGYIGKIQERVDFDLIEKCIQSCDNCTFEICGPIYSQQKRIKELKKKYTNINFTGDIHYNKLPEAMKKMDIAIIPHKIDSFTESMNPLKLYEYLAAGKPVISMAVAGTDAISPYVYNCNNSEEFIDALKKVIEEVNRNAFSPQKIQASIPSECSWEFRTNLILEKFEIALKKKSKLINCKLGFVILHYMTFEDTVLCIESIKNNVSEKKHIVVVDNASSNDSFKKLREKYKNDSEITLVRSDENIGFARGNNLGIEKLRSMYRCEYISVMNNDTIIKQNNWYDLINDEYKKSGFAVLGPKIITKDGDDTSNPMRKKPLEMKAIDNLIWRRRIKVFLCKTGLHKFVNPAGTKKGISEFEHDKRYENVQLHGACMIFSEKFYEKLHGFDSRTFLYLEEDIMFLNLLENDLKSVYLPNLEIYHSEDSSTNKIVKSSCDKKIFVFTNEINSLKILKKIKKQKKSKATKR